MEIFNQNKVSVPSLPTDGASVKERLAHEVASRIVQYMNMNDPNEFRVAHFHVRHHGDQIANCTVMVAEGVIGGDWYYKSGSKVCEAVLEKLSRISRIDSVKVSLYPGFNFGTFAPDSPAEAAKSDPRKERVKKLKDAMKQLREEHFLFTNVRYTAEVRATTGKRIGELLNVFGKDYGEVTIAQRSDAQFVKEATDILDDIVDDIGNAPGVTVYFTRGYAEELKVEL